MSFYASVNRKVNQDESILYKLNYLEDAPRKSTINNVSVDARIFAIRNLAFDDQVSKMFLIGKSQNKGFVKNFSNQHFSQSSLQFSGLETVYESQNQLIDIKKVSNQQIAFVSDKEIVIKDLTKNQFDHSRQAIAPQGQSISHCVVDPFKGHLIYNVNNQIYIQDKKQKKKNLAFKVSSSQNEKITNMDCNTSKIHYLMTGHNDFMKFWDMRKSNIPIKVVEDHHSLLLKALYNPSHDQLILGCYDDGEVGLFRMGSVSSTPSGQGTDALVKIYDEHEDSVYHACWGQSPWIFASVSYSANNIVVNIVPSVEKYRILL